MDEDDVSYKRNQVIWAIWQSLAHSQTTGESPPAWLETRVKRLLDLDRAENMPGFAFMETSPRGRGADTAFTDFDAFCLALGIELLDAGFKQSEIVFLLKYCRHRLSKEFKEMMVNHPIPLRSQVSATEYSDLPSYRKDSQDYADFRRFMLIEKVELKEAFPTRKKTKDPLILEPVICKGVTELMQELNERGWNLRKVLILELSTTATLVKEHLDKAQEARRGRG